MNTATQCAKSADIDYIPGTAPQQSASISFAHNYLDVIPSPNPPDLMPGKWEGGNEKTQTVDIALLAIQ
jgi:hypothetical protein